MINKLNNQIVIYFTCYNFNISFTVRTSEFVMQSDNFNRCAVFQMSPMSTVITFGPFYKCQTNNMFEFLWLEFMTNTALFTLIYFFFISAIKRVINLCGFPWCFESRWASFIIVQVHCCGFSFLGLGPRLSF